MFTSSLRSGGVGLVSAGQAAGVGGGGGIGVGGIEPPQLKGSLGRVGCNDEFEFTNVGYLLRPLPGLFGTRPCPSMPILPFTIRFARSSKRTEPSLAISWHM